MIAGSISEQFFLPGFIPCQGFPGFFVIPQKLGINCQKHYFRSRSADNFPVVLRQLSRHLPGGGIQQHRASSIADTGQIPVICKTQLIGNLTAIFLHISQIGCLYIPLTVNSAEPILHGSHIGSGFCHFKAYHGSAAVRRQSRRHKVPFVLGQFCCLLPGCASVAAVPETNPAAVFLPINLSQNPDAAIFQHRHPGSHQPLRQRQLRLHIASHGRSLHNLGLLPPYRHHHAGKGHTGCRSRSGQPLYPFFCISLHKPNLLPFSAPSLAGDSLKNL